MRTLNRILLFFCCICFISCDKDKNENEAPPAEVLMGGAIIIDHSPNLSFTELDIYPEGISSNEEIGASRKRYGVKSTSATDDIRGNDYRFKLVGEFNTLKIDGEEVQATHVKITDDARYAFVSYNSKGPDYKGGIVILNVSDISKPVKVDAILMPSSEVSAIDYDANTNMLYITGATIDPNLGYDEADEFGGPAFYMVMALNGDKTFKQEDPRFITTLGSFQGTSIQKSADKVYITTGDGTGSSKGGLYIYNVSDNSRVKYIEKDYVRSVDIDPNHIYLMQSQPARISKYDLNGNVTNDAFYRNDQGANQENAKSEILFWNNSDSKGSRNYILAALNEGGLQMIHASDGTLNDALDAPGQNQEKDVTNSVAINSDQKTISKTTIKSNLLLLANGEKGIYWYDISYVDNKDQILLCNANSFSFGDGYSANYIASKKNIVFVADGLGGLKILSIEFDEGPPPPPSFEGCVDVEKYFNFGLASFLPNGNNVFGSKASENAKILFQSPNAVKDVPDHVTVTGKTDIYFTYIACTASFRNTVGFFVVPASHKDLSNADYFNSIKADFIKTDLGNGSFVLNDKFLLLRNMANKELVAGDSWKIKNYHSSDGSFAKDDRAVIFIIPNGWVSQNSRVQFSLGGYNSPLFMDRDMNLSIIKEFSDANYHGYTEFKGVQYNTFYSEDCNSLVFFYEDKFDAKADYDFNDMIFAITDNPAGEAVTNIVSPRWRMSESGKLEDTTK